MSDPTSDLHFREATRGDLKLIVDLLENANDSGIADIGTVAEEKCFGPDARSEPVTRLALRGGKAVGLTTVSGRTLRLIAVRRDERRRKLGSRMLTDSEKTIGKSHDRLEVAAAAGNYFTPGVNEVDQGTLAFFVRHSYVADPEPAIDLSVSLPIAQETDDHDSHDSNVRIRRCTSDDRETLFGFIAARFARAWAWEIDLAFDAPSPTCLIATRGSEWLGFSGWELNNRGLGTFGPQGVIEQARGLGVGRTLLHATLDELYKMGYQTVRIPWVSSIEYYRKSCGAAVTARYTQFSKPLIRIIHEMS